MILRIRYFFYELILLIYFLCCKKNFVFDIMLRYFVNEFVILVKWLKLFFNDIFSEIYFFVIVFEVFVRSDEIVLVCLIGWFYFLEVG